MFKESSGKGVKLRITGWGCEGVNMGDLKIWAQLHTPRQTHAVVK